MDKEIICDFGNLYKAYNKAKAGKGYNGSCAKFQTMSLEGLHLLKEQLESRTYRMNPYNEFKIYEPKERVIKSCSFKDKVVQHCLCDEILHPRLAGEFIRTNYAGQVGKGTHFGMDCLKEQMFEFYRVHGLDGWILKCDITKFFYQIDHEILKDIVDYHFGDEYTQWLNHLFIDSTEGLGLPLGNQVAQVYALLMLNGLDHFITGELGIQFYGRYMDDFYLIHHDKEYLKWCLECIRDMVESLGLSLNGKTQICPFKCGLGFTGFHHYITADGKYIRKLKGENKRRMQKKIRTWAKLVKTGRMTEQKFYEKYNAWKNHALHGNCIKLCHSMDLLVERLLCEDECNMLKFVQVTPVGGDCCCGYDVTLDREYTVDEFIQTVLKERGNEWGDIKIKDVEQHCNYSSGKIVDNMIPIEYLGKKIRKVRAYGGWSYMDYVITV